MKIFLNKKFLPFIINLLFLTPLSAQDSSLVGYWTFDDSTAVDSSVYLNKGTLYGNPIFLSGIKGSAIYFDGIDDYLRIKDSKNLDTDSSMTISFWIKPDSVNSGGAKAISKWYSAPEEGDWLLSLSSRDSCGGNCVSYYFVFANYSVYGTTNGWFSIGPHNVDYYLKLGEWNFLTITFDTGFVNLYYNGSLIYTDTTVIKYTSLREYSTDDIYIGRYHSGKASYNFKGGFDEIRIYNRPLGASEVKDIYSQVTSIKNPVNKNKLPQKFALLQNYPNPFNPTTTIKYEIPNLELHGNTYLQLKVYDVLGEEIATLVNEAKQPGRYEIEFNAADLPSGVYFYQLKAGSFVQTKKMILIK